MPKNQGSSDISTLYSQIQRDTFKDMDAVLERIFDSLVLSDANTELALLSPESYRFKQMTNKLLSQLIDAEAELCEFELIIIRNNEFKQYLRELRSAFDKYNCMPDELKQFFNKLREMDAALQAEFISRAIKFLKNEIKELELRIGCISNEMLSYKNRLNIITVELSDINDKINAIDSKLKHDTSYLAKDIFSDNPDFGENIDAVKNYFEDSFKDLSQSYDNFMDKFDNIIHSCKKYIPMNNQNVAVKIIDSIKQKVKGHVIFNSIEGAIKDKENLKKRKVVLFSEYTSIQMKKKAMELELSVLVKKKEKACERLSKLHSNLTTSEKIGLLVGLETSKVKVEEKNTVAVSSVNETSVPTNDNQKSPNPNKLSKTKMRRA